MYNKSIFILNGIKNSLNTFTKFDNNVKSLLSSLMKITALYPEDCYSYFSEIPYELNLNPEDVVRSRYHWESIISKHENNSLVFKILSYIGKCLFPVSVCKRSTISKADVWWELNEYRDHEDLLDECLEEINNSSELVNLRFALGCY